MVESHKPQSQPQPPKGDPSGASKHRKIQKQLDEALADSFPASDPVSIVTSQEEEDWGTEPTPPEPPKAR